MLREIKLSNSDRERLKVLTRSVVTRLLPQTPELQGTLNRGENRAIRFFSSVPGLLLGGIVYFLLWQFGDQLAGLPFAERLTDSTGMLITSLVVFLLFVFFNPFAGWLDNHFMQFWSGIYMFRHKWSQGEQASEILDAAESLIRTRPDKIIGSLREEAEERDQVALPKHLMASLHGFPGPGQPVIFVIRKFMERRLKSQYVADRFEGMRADERDYKKKYFIRARAVRNAIRTQLLFNELGAELRAEIPAGPDWQRFHWSEPSSQETTLFDSKDLHQRFRTAAPHYRWPVASAKDSVGETAIYRIVAAIENPLRQPIYAVSVKEAVDLFPMVIREFIEHEEGDIDEDDERIPMLTALYLDLLQTVDVQMFGKWDRRTLRPSSDVHIIPQPILKNAAPAGQEPDWLLRWDPNRIDWSLFDDSDGNTRRAFAVLSNAIDALGKKAQPIILSRGDAVLIDNQRCLIARHEIETEQIANYKRAALYPQSWWLRGYYGFRQPNAVPIVGHEVPHPVTLTDAEVENASDFVDEPPLDIPAIEEARTEAFGDVIAPDQPAHAPQMMVRRDSE